MLAQNPRPRLYHHPRSSSMRSLRCSPHQRNPKWTLMPAWGFPSRTRARATHSQSCWLATRRMGLLLTPPPGVHVNLQKGKKGAGSSSSSKLQGPLGRAPPLTDPMEQHLFELATGGSTALEHLHNERTGSNATLTRGTPTLPSDVHSGLPGASAASDTPAKKGNAGLSRVQAGSLQRVSDKAETVTSKSSTGLSDPGSGRVSQEQQQLSGASRTPPPIFPELLKQHPERLPGQVPGALGGSQASGTMAQLGSSMQDAFSSSAAFTDGHSASARKANPAGKVSSIGSAAGHSSMTSKPDGKVLPGADATDAHPKGQALDADRSVASHLMEASSDAQPDMGTQGKGRQQTKPAAKNRIPPSERASNARLSRAEARRQSQARRLEAAGSHTSSG